MKTENLVVAAAMATLVLAPGAAFAAGDSGPGGPSKAVSFEEIPGSDVKRVILTEKAAERLGIETGEIGEQQIILKQMVGGRVVPPVVDEAPAQKLAGGSFGGFGQAEAIAQPASVQQASAPAELPDLTEAWVVVTLSPDEWERVRKDKPARLLPLETREAFPAELMASPTPLEPLEDPKRTMLNAFYTVDGEDHGLTLNQRLRVELELIGTDEEQMVAPYSAVYYDGTGQAWVYTNPEPLVFERQPISVERIDGDLAILSDGPPVGTTVTTIGASLLYGAEVIFGR